jgi:hypothetical protein
LQRGCATPADVSRIPHAPQENSKQFKNQML